MKILDCEIYDNYFLCSFLDIGTREVTHFEKFNDCEFDRPALSKIMCDNLTGSFNGNGFDLYIIEYALRGATNKQLKRLCNQLITDKRVGWMVAKDFDLRINDDWDHVDIMNVAIGQTSLKIYGGRLNAPKLQDLPINPDETLSSQQANIIKHYCINDLETTELMFGDLRKQVDLRVSMSEQYGVDLRSKSDAQIAEAVIKSELHNLTGKDYRRPTNVATSVKYRNPKIVNFKSVQLRDILARILRERYAFKDNGQIAVPRWMMSHLVQINNGFYKMGVGGLHSCETQQRVVATANTSLFELDVASYYPAIILQQNLAPANLGAPFLNVYKTIVDRRLKAKREGDKVTADTLKICVNGSFGKFGSKWSSLYAPELLIQTTLTGQLALLMLIERLESERITVVSANTDGVVVHCAKSREDDVARIASQWEAETSFVLERTDYLQLASRDVNNYIAVKPDGSTKGKGIFASRSIGKNPEFLIVYEAVAAFLSNGVPIIETIRQSADITKFIAIRNVTGGAIYNDELLGKAVRFYYSTNSSGQPIRYVKNGNKVPKTDGAIPLMDLPDTFPTDVNFETYISLANGVLEAVGYA